MHNYASPRWGFCNLCYISLLQFFHRDALGGVIKSLVKPTPEGWQNCRTINVGKNGIIKNEYLIDYQVYNLSQAKELLASVVQLYNEEIPHLSIGLLTPNQVHQQNLKTEILWRNYYPKKDNVVNQLQDINKNVNPF